MENPGGLDVSWTSFHYEGRVSCLRERPECSTGVSDGKDF